MEREKIIGNAGNNIVFMIIDRHFVLIVSPNKKVNVMS